MSVEFKVDFRADRKGRKRAVTARSKPVEAPSPGRIPRVTRLMALAIRFEGLVRDGEVEDYADIARLGHVTRARVTQIMNLLHLAPEIQCELLHLPAVTGGRDPVREKHLRPIAAVVDWRKQGRMWSALSRVRPDSH
ncbi:MAG: hypothetical protein JNK58_08920 [Phycisphaerae bacterium]|nr:hypothetical protein [Phycisphaerae bacterium]